jgi:hypothetical protein
MQIECQQLFLANRRGHVAPSQKIAARRSSRLDTPLIHTYTSPRWRKRRAFVASLAALFGNPVLLFPSLTRAEHA